MRPEQQASKIAREQEQGQKREGAAHLPMPSPTITIISVTSLTELLEGSSGVILIPQPPGDDGSSTTWRGDKRNENPEGTQRGYRMDKSNVTKTVIWNPTHTCHSPLNPSDRLPSARRARIARRRVPDDDEHSRDLLPSGEAPAAACPTCATDPDRATWEASNALRGRGTLTLSRAHARTSETGAFPPE